MAAITSIPAHYDAMVIGTGADRRITLLAACVIAGRHIGQTGAQLKGGKG